MLYSQIGTFNTAPSVPFDFAPPLYTKDGAILCRFHVAPDPHIYHRMKSSNIQVWTETARYTARTTGRETGKETGMDSYGDQADGIIDNAIEELLEWARLHGYDPNENGCVFLDPVIEYVTESMEKPEDYDFAELLRKTQNSGVFEKIPTRSFDDKFPPDRQQDYVIAMSDDGKIGIFYDDMFMFYKGQYHEISRDEVPLDWFRRYTIFTEADLRYSIAP